MKIVLITTTINVPNVLRLYRGLSSSVEIIIIGDRKTPHNEVRKLASELGEASYYSDQDQTRLGYKCSEIIGWDKIMRRNLGILEAIRRHADIVISIDDDNIPLNSRYFADFAEVLSRPYSGLVASSEVGWFDAGMLLDPRVHHRGFPLALRNNDLKIHFQPRTDIKVGVSAGLWLGDPDIDAIERLSNEPTVVTMSELGRGGVAVDSKCYSPFDSQNTAYRGDLAPLMMLPVGIGRYDDIWASFIAQRIMREEGFHVRFGPPLVLQQRNPQDPITNLRDELYGMEYTLRFCNDLNAAELGSGKLLDKLYAVHEYVEKLGYVPRVVHELGRAWCDDVQSMVS